MMRCPEPVPVIDPFVRRILDFWFLPKWHAAHGKPRDIWFTASDTFDAEIVRRFGKHIERALSGRYDQIATTPEGALALVLLLDQFTRNAFRRTARAFAGDARARQIARRALARGF